MIIEYSFDEQFKKDFKKLDRKDKSYALRELDGIGEQLDVNEFSRRFFSIQKLATADVSVDSNSNVDKVTVVHYNNELSKPLNRLNSYYLVWKYGRRLFGEEVAYEIIEKQFTKEFYINDFHGFNQSYCFNFSCMDLLIQGIKFGGQVQSKPANHLSSFAGHIIAFITYACNQALGAIGLADFLICCSWFVKKIFQENKNIPREYLEKQIKQEIQGIIYQVNQPFRSSLQSPFVNISIYDDIFLQKYCDEYLFPDQTRPDKEIIKYLQNLYINLMNETLEKTPITFPITTACIAINDKKEILDENFLNYVSEKNLKYGFMNIYAGKTSILSSCCRLRSDSSKDYFNTFGSGGTKIGSLGVVTLNLPRLAYESKNRAEFFKKLKNDVELISKINHIKRFIVQKRIDSQYLSLYNLGFMNINKQYSTCGMIGINETIEILGENILEEQGQKLVEEILITINNVNQRQEEHYKTPHNIEQVPGEASAIKLAEADKILGYNKKYALYSNQFIPLTIEADIYDRIKLQGKFDKYMTGGAICHLNIVDSITSKGYMKRLIKTTIENGVVYHAINYNLQQCKDEHIIVGKNKKCPICGKNILKNFTRVVGFLTDTSNWQKIRREKDYLNRKFYNLEKFL